MAQSDHEVATPVVGVGVQTVGTVPVVVAVTTAGVSFHRTASQMVDRFSQTVVVEIASVVVRRIVDAALVLDTACVVVVVVVVVGDEVDDEKRGVEERWAWVEPSVWSLG